jgi:hypothetical protein
LIISIAISRRLKGARVSVVLSIVLMSFAIALSGASAVVHTVPLLEFSVFLPMRLAIRHLFDFGVLLRLDD